MTKGLQALESIIFTFYNKDREDIKIVKKELKALEIIKEKEVNVQEFKLCLDNDWNYELCEKYCQDNNKWEENPPYNHSMTREEYELLKEVLL